MEDIKAEERRSEIKEKKGEKSGLTTDFFSSLVKQPVCKTKGYCDGCGLCQH